MDVVCVHPQTDPRWQTLLQSAPCGVFHSPQWIAVLVETYGFDIEALVLMDDEGKPVAGMPFCQINDLRGERIVSLPFSDYSDPIVRTREQWDILSTALITRQLPIRLRCVHSTIPLEDARFTLSNRARWHGLDLGPDLDAHWDTLESSARRAIAKSQRSGVTVKLAEDESELHAFFELHARTRKYKYHLLAQPYAFFKNIWQQFVESGMGAVMLAIYQGRPIAGIFFLLWQNNLIYKFNASDSDYLCYRPTDQLVWEGIRFGKERQCIRLDFGLSDWDQEGLLRFKRKFASEEKTISFLTYLPEKPALKAHAQIQALLPELTALFTDAAVPDSVTEHAGDLLYQFFA